jgi:C4-dicarboxylate-specific signal transduction histidine kinase
VALASSTVGFTVLAAIRNEAGRIIDFSWQYANPEAGRIIGRNPLELIGKQIREVFPDAWAPAGLFESYVHVVETGEQAVIEAGVTRNGVSSWWQHIAAKLDDGVAVWFPDITEQKIAEATLRAAQSELVRVSRLTTLGELTASIAHEVNQPLAAIIAHGSAARRWLGRSSPNIDEAVKAIEGVIANASRAHDVIARIRALARKADGERESLDLNEIIREILALTDGELRQNSVTLRTDFDPTLPRTFGDRVQLQQVALNLVMNGVEAICALTEGPRELAIRTSLNDRQELHVAVRDSGVGLAEVDLQRIFEPFYTTKPQGMGIGLSISRSIVQAHYGRLWAERNKDASGITVHFTVPVRDGFAGEGDPGVPRA